MEMVMPSIFIEMKDEEMMYVDGGGFVGLNIRVSKATGKDGAWTCSMIAGAATVATLSYMTAVGGPLGVSASFLGGGIVQKAVFDGVSSGRMTIPIGINIPLVSWVRTIQI